MPGGEKPGGLGVTKTGGVLREVALLGNGVETGKKSQAFVGRQGHDMALAFDRPELQGQRGAERMGRGDHLRARQIGRQLFQPEPDKLRDEEKQSAAAGRERARLKRKGPGVGHRLHRRSGIIGTLFIQAPGKRSESLLLQHLPHGGRTQGPALFLQGLTDLVDRIVLLAEADDRLSGGRLLGLSPGAVPGRDEEQRIGIARSSSRSPRR